MSRRCCARPRRLPRAATGRACPTHAAASPLTPATHTMLRVSAALEAHELLPQVSRSAAQRRHQQRTRTTCSTKGSAGTAAANDTTLRWILFCAISCSLSTSHNRTVQSRDPLNRHPALTVLAANALMVNSCPFSTPTCPPALRPPPTHPTPEHLDLDLARA